MVLNPIHSTSPSPSPSEYYTILEHDAVTPLAFGTSSAHSGMDNAIINYAKQA